jgi:hypothetical protein
MGLLRSLPFVSSNRPRLSLLFPDEILPRLLLSTKDTSNLLSVEATTIAIITASSFLHLPGSTPHLQDPEWLMGHRRRPLPQQQRQPPRSPRSPEPLVRLYPVQIGVCLVVVIVRVRVSDMMGTLAPGFLRRLHSRHSGWFWQESLINRIRYPVIINNSTSNFSLVRLRLIIDPSFILLFFPCPFL